jgi:integrase
VRKLGRCFWIRYSLRGKRIEEKTDAANESEARKILNERLGPVAKGETPSAVSKVRLSEPYADMQADYRNKGHNLRILAKNWAHVEGVFGTDRVSTIDHGRMQRYIDVRRDVDKAAPATVQGEIAVLRRMIRLGKRKGTVAQLPDFPTITVQNTRSGFFERDEFECVRAELPDYLRPLVTVGYWLGWRIGELLALQWRQVDLDRGTIRLDAGTTKNDEGRLAYLPPEALEVLEDWRSETAKLEKARGVIIPHVFHHDGRPIRNCYTAWRSACARAGFGGRLFHDLRRTAARNYRRQGVSEGVVMKIGGWKTRSMFDRYNIQNEADRREAAAMVSQGSARNGLGKKWERIAEVRPLKASSRSSNAG